VRSEIDITNGARLRRRLKRRESPLRNWRRLGAIAALILLVFALPAILKTFVGPAEPAFAREDPRGSYAVVAFDRSGQTEEEVELSAAAADLLAFYLDGWDRVDATLEHELAGTRLELGLQGPAIPSLEDALRLTRKIRVGTLIGLRTRIFADTVHLDARKYDVETGEPLGPSKQVRAAVGDLQALVMPVASEILEFRGEDPDALKQESGSQEAWQQFIDARSALYDWRLDEAESGFRAAIAYDPDFARAHHYLAVTLFWKTSRDIARRTELLPSIQRITTDAHRLASATDLNPALERHIGGLNSFASGDYESAREHFNKQIETDSTDTEALLFLGVVEWTDPWLAEGIDPPQPRGDINLARQAFQVSSRLWPEFQLSRGMQFEITGDLSDFWRGPWCPMFMTPDDDLVVPPYQEPFDADWVALYPTLEGDSIQWVQCDDAFVWDDRAEARLVFVPWAEKLYQESIADIERWARFAPEQARPREEWADLVLWWRSRMACDADTSVANQLTREALGHLDAALALSADTAPKLKIDHAVLRLAAGLADAAETARLVDAALLEMEQPAGAPFAVPSWAAANAYLAAGKPSRAIDHMRGIWANEGRSTEDPSDPEIRHEHGDVFQHVGEIRVLGAVGATGPRLDAAVAEVNWAWSAPSYPDPERRRAVLRQSSALLERARSADIRPALALDPHARKLWFSEWGDLEEKIPDVWRGLLALEHGPDSAAVWLAPAVERLEAMPRPYATEYFITGLLAQQVGEHETAEDLFGRIQTCPQRIGLIDVGWGLTRLGRLYRARSLEQLALEDEAASEISIVEAEWAEAEPEVRELVEEAREAIRRTAARN
jgi:tetratricopeptide (TPR) repeat protein